MTRTPAEPLADGKMIEIVARAIWNTLQDDVIGSRGSYALKMRLSWDEARRAAENAIAAYNPNDRLREACIADVWRQADENHRTYSDTGDRENDIRFLTLGLTGEAGEVANFVKKRWRDGDGHDEAIQKEIADVCAYAFMLANTMGMTPADLIRVIAEKQQVFIEKMQTRRSPIS